MSGFPLWAIGARSCWGTLKLSEIWFRIFPLKGEEGWRTTLHWLRIAHGMFSIKFTLILSIWYPATSMTVVLIFQHLELPPIEPSVYKRNYVPTCFCSLKGSVWTLDSMLGWDALGGASVHHIISEIAHREPGAIAIDGTHTVMLVPVFLKDERFKASEGIMGNCEHTNAIMVLITFQ